MSCSGLSKVFAVLLILVVFAGVSGGAYYLYDSSNQSGSGSQQPSSTDSPSPAPETPSPAPIVPVGDNYEPDNSFDQYSDFLNYNVDYTQEQSFLSSQERTIFPVGDKDYIRVFLEGGYTYLFDAFGSTCDVYASLYNSGHEMVASNDNGQYDQNFVISYPATQSGNYFLVVGAHTVEGDSGDYNIELSCMATPVAMTLDDAIRQGLVQLTVSGQGLQSVGGTIKSLSTSLMNITVTAGTKFETQSSGVQNMVTLADTAILVKPLENTVFAVNTACTNMHLDMPASADTFTINHNIPSDLTTLLNAPAFNTQTFRVQQFAIWTITDNPSRGGYTEIGSSNNYSGPSDTEMQSIQTLFQTAGINTQNYSAFQ